MDLETDLTFDSAIVDIYNTNKILENLRDRMGADTFMLYQIVMEK